MPSLVPRALPFALVLIAVRALPLPSAAPEAPSDGRYPAVIEKLKNAGLEAEGAYEMLRTLTANGPRLTGSAGAAAAVETMRRMMLDAGLENVRLEPVTVDRWVRGAESASIVDPPRGEPAGLAISALGGSVATPAGGVTAPVVEVRGFEELAALGEGAAGRIVLFNRAMDRTLLEPYRAYGGAVDQRTRGASEAARLGAVAVLVRSLTLREDDFPHTGMLQYDKDVPRIPAAAVSTRDASRLSSLLRSGKGVRVRLVLDCRDMGPVPSANVMGEIRGAELPGEIILLGGHLDSWDLGTGAHDDGAGCVASLEALRLVRACGLKPKRTLRVVLFMDEEFGGTGGRFYAEAKGRKGERHIAALESDGGGFAPIALATGPPEVQERLGRWAPLFESLGIRWTRPGGGGVDVAPLAKDGCVFLGVAVESHRYFDVHHSALDILSAVHPRELELLSVVLAAYAYLIAQEGV